MAKAFLKDFLKDVENDNSHKSQLQKYTDRNGTFLPNNETRLVTVLHETASMICLAFTSQQYGATIMKMGWHVPKWNDDYFAVSRGDLDRESVPTVSIAFTSC
jgi:hypothetical protein